MCRVRSYSEEPFSRYKGTLYGMERFHGTIDANKESLFFKSVGWHQCNVLFIFSAPGSVYCISDVSSAGECSTIINNRGV